MRRLLLLVFATWLMSGCAKRVKIKVKTTTSTNDGRALHLVVRETDSVAFYTETYTQIEEAIATRDASVLHQEVLYPGQKARLKVDAPENAVGIYLMFTEPVGADWKYMVETPRRRKVRLKLARNRIR